MDFFETSINAIMQSILFVSKRNQPSIPLSLSIVHYEQHDKQTDRQTDRDNNGLRKFQETTSPFSDSLTCCFRTNVSGKVEMERSLQNLGFRSFFANSTSETIQEPLPKISDGNSHQNTLIFKNF